MTDEAQGFDQKISDIKSEIAKLDAKTLSSSETIKAQRSAYFASYIDGYEEELSSKTLDKLTCDEVESITDRKSTAPNVVGKLIDGYGWYLAVVADNSKKEYEIGKDVMLKFDSSAETYPAVIYDIRDEKPDRSLIIISCSKFNYELVQHRAEIVEVISLIDKNEQCEGLKVPREAIRFADIKETYTDENGNEKEKTIKSKGVYIRKGEQVLFKKIDVRFEGNDYVLSKVHPESEYLQLYDDIMLEGVDKDDEKE